MNSAPSRPYPDAYAVEPGHDVNGESQPISALVLPATRASDCVARFMHRGCSIPALTFQRIIHLREQGDEWRGLPQTELKVINVKH